MHVGAVRAKKWGAQPVGGPCGPIGVSRTAGLQSVDFMTTLGPPPFQGRAAPGPAAAQDGPDAHSWTPDTWAKGGGCQTATA